MLVGWLAYKVVFDRPSLKEAAKEMGIAKFSAVGVEISLAESSDELPKAKAALDNANVKLTELQRRYSEAISALKASQEVFAANGIGNTAEQARAKPLVGKAIAESQSTLERIRQAKSQLTSATSSTASAIEKLPGASDKSLGFGIVFGADRDPKSADDQLALARRAGLDPRLFRRQRSLRSVVVFQSNEEAKAALPTLRSLNRYSKDAYIVNLASWCPEGDLSDNPVSCGF